MKTLVIDNNMDKEYWGAKDIRALAAEYSQSEVHVRRGPSETIKDDLNLSSTSYTHLILSGSRNSCLIEASWVNHLDELIRSFAKENKPILGICFGHQSICRALAGRSYLHKGQTPEFGWTKIQTLKKNALFEGLNDSFYSYSSHYEEMNSLPDGFELLASSKDCRIQAYQVGLQPIYGVQFHPEKSLEDCKASLQSKVKSKQFTGLLHPKESDRYYNPEVGKTIFKNFFNLTSKP